MMSAHKYRVETAVGEAATIDNKVHSKETIKQFTRLFIENIFYERNILNKNHFTDNKFFGIKLKKICDDSESKLAKHLPIYYEGIDDALEKGLLQQLIVRICKRGFPADCLEEYTMAYIYYPEDTPKACAQSKSAMSIKTIMNNMKFCITKYFLPLPSLSELDILIYMKLDDEKTPQDYIAPYFNEALNTLIPNDEHYECALGTLKTSFIKVKGRVEGIPRLRMKMESDQMEEISQTQSSNEEDITIILPDEEDL